MDDDDDDYDDDSNIQYIQKQPHLLQLLDFV